ncbi:MAG: 50S ribosomal protein L3 N(5)-glutamine methyltransferase [Pseudomonadota bacterium]
MNAAKIKLEKLIVETAQSLENSDIHFGHGTDNALDEAHWLVLHALGLPVDQAVEDYDLLVSGNQCESVKTIVRERIQTKKPLAYLLNSAWFMGLEFFVDERVLVPRSPIAELIDTDFFGLLESDSSHRILDMCTGSGCIAIACAYAYANAVIVGSDLSTDALDVAAINKKKHQLDSQLELVQSDLFDAIDGKFDLIVSNPPYVDAQDMATLNDEFTSEPQLGLDGGEDGLVLVDRMMAEAREYLTDDGLLVVEVGNSAPAMEKKYAHLPLTWLEFANGGHGVFAIRARDL